MVSKLALGTVQFGLDYGISNNAGQVKPQEISSILQTCRKAGLTTLDTAAAYGESEQLLGMAGVDSFRIITKIPPGCKGIAKAEEVLRASFSNLKLQKIYGWLYHSFSDYADGNLPWSEVVELQRTYGITKIGFSLYEPDEWKRIMDDGIIPDIIQVPFSILDRRFEEVMIAAKKLGTEVHTRSTFLQGLFFMNTDGMKSHFDPVKPLLNQITEVVTKHDLDLASSLLMFATTQPFVDKVVVGITSNEQLVNNITNLSDATNDLTEYLDPDTLIGTPDDILNPALWT